MVTLVGTQHDFSNVVMELLRLEYDALGAYKLAIKNLINNGCKAKLKEFSGDHERHIKEIKDVYSSSLKLPRSGDVIKGAMTKMKVSIGSIIGSDINILKAMLDNEKDTNTAYERIVNHPLLPNENKEIFTNAYLDEKHHKQWLEDYINSQKSY